jgi:hypothetical protein
MEKPFKEKIEDAIKEFENIEYRNRTWRSQFMKEMNIWETIAFNLNSSEGAEYKHWVLVMDLYHKKYKQEKVNQ